MNTAKKIIVAAILFVAITPHANGQTSWEKLFSALNTDVFRCVREVPAGGYILAGYTSNFNSNDTDAYVVRLDNAGDTLWTYKYNGPLSKKDLFYKVIPTSDGGFALCGYTTSVTGISDDVMYMKLNSAGQQQWVKFWGGSGKERGQEIIQTGEGNYAIVGYTTSTPAQYYDAFFLRINSNGDTLWTRRYGSSNYDDANTVQQLADGGFIMGGQSSNGANGLDHFLVRIGPTGDLYWTNKFGTTLTDNTESLLVLSDGFIIAGNTNTAASGDNGYISKRDTSGNLIWEKTFGGSLPDDFHRIDFTTDGGYVACGTTTSTGPIKPNMWLMKINSSGDSLWSKTYGRDNHDHGYSAQQTSDGGFIIAGHTGSFGWNYEEAYVVKTDASGNPPNKLTYTTVLDLITPNPNTCGSANTPIRLVVRNFGNKSVANIPVTVEISGSLTQTINQTLSASADTVTLSTTINTSAGGTYTFHCYTSNGNNVYPERNSFTKTVTIDVTPSAPTGTGNTRCGTGSVMLSASATTPVYWFTAPSGGISVNTGTTYTTPSLSATTTYYLQTGTTCPSARVPVTATIVPVSPDPVTAGASRCGTGTLTLTATSADPVTWYDAPSGGNIVGTGLSFTTPSLSSTTNYYAQASNGATCPSNRIIAVATVSSVASDPVTASSSRCGAGQVTLTATSSSPVIWYDAASGGNQVGTGLSFTTPSLSSTTNYWAQADNGCISNRIQATATINPLAADPITNGGENCGAGTVVLTATASDPIEWFDVPVGGTVIGTGTSFTTPLITSGTNYYAQANNGTCPSNRAIAFADILTVPSVYLGADTVILGSVHQLDAGSGFVSYLWSNGSTNQTISISTTDTYCVTVTAANGCTTTDCIFVDMITGKNSLEALTGVNLYPNPTNGKLFIGLTTGKFIDEIEVRNLQGKLLKRVSKIDAPVVDADLSELAKGFYLISVRSGESISIHRIAIQ